MEHITVQKTHKYLIVRIPLGSVEKKSTKQLLSRRGIRVSIDEGLHDIAMGKVIGPFTTVKAFKKVMGKS